MMESAMAGAAARAAAKIPETRPTRPLDEYCGTFRHPGFGSFTLEQKDGALTGKWNGFDTIFTHYHYDSYDMMLPLMGATLPARFLSSVDGHIALLEVVLEPTPGIAPIVFVKE